MSVSETALPEPPPSANRFARSREIARGLQLDRAVFYVLITRLWQLLAGPATLLLVVHYFSPEMQGFYYAFASLLAFQTLFDLNVNVVLLIGAGREWVSLDLDPNGRVVGESAAAEQLASLTRFGGLWYRGAAILFLLLVGGAGLLMFRGKGLAPTDQFAWVATILTAASVLTFLPRLAILQGCHQILAVNRNVALQTVCSSVAIWACLVAGLGLWAVPLAWLVRLGWNAWLVQYRFRNLFGSLQQCAVRAINWKTEIWPLQWRIALQGISSSILMASYVLALFHMHSEAAAGRMGATQSVLQMLLWGGLAWVQTRIPRLSGLAKQDERAAYNHLFDRMTILTFGVVLLGAMGGWLGLMTLDTLNIRVGEVRLADRFVPPAAFALTAVAIAAQHLLNCLTIYSRTRQRESFVLPTVLLNTSLAAGIWLVAEPYGETGVALVAAGALALVGIPVWLFIWNKERQNWPVPSKDEG